MADTLSDNVRRGCRSPRRAGFTLIELLVVIGIIVILIGILVPTISSVRKHAQTTATQSTMNRIAQAINIYYNDHQNYPGALPNSYFRAARPTNPKLTGLTKPSQYTQAEDGAMALIGGWQFDSGNSQILKFTKAELGNGPLSYNTLPTAAKRYNAYMEYRPADFSPVGPSGDPVPLSTQAELGLSDCKDTEAPEFMDNYSQPRPIIYVRANPVQTQATSTPISADYATDSSYNFSQIAAYLNPKDFSGQTDPTSGAIANMFRSPTGGAVFAGSYVLLDAGADRIFGTPDDIIVSAGGAQ